VKGDKGPGVAGVCVVESHEDCIEFHNGQPAEEGNEAKLLPPLDARVDRVHRLRGHVHTVTNGLTRVLSLSLSLSLSLCLSVFLSAHACVRVLARVVLRCAG